MKISSKFKAASSLSGEHLLAGLSRFSLVGILATLTYFSLANGFIWLDVMPPAMASVVAYLMAIPVSFFGQSRFTFRVTSNTQGQFIRFCALNGCGLLISYGSVRLATDVLGVKPFWGTVVASVTVPLLSYFVMKFWVFNESDDVGRATGESIDYHQGR